MKIAIDTSAIMAILLQEEDAAMFSEIIQSTASMIMSTTTFLELHAVVRHKFGKKGLELLDRFIDTAKISIEAFTAEQARIGAKAYAQYAGILNFGDCVSYALAKSENVPLLFKGQDFLKTDVQTV